MQGFSLIELVIVISLMALLTAVSLHGGLEEFDRSLGLASVSQTTAIVRHARAQALHIGEREVSAMNGTVSIKGTAAVEESYALTGQAKADIYGRVLFGGLKDFGGMGSFLFSLSGIPIREIWVGAEDSINSIRLP